MATTCPVSALDQELAGLLVPFRDHRPVLDPVPPRVPHFLIQMRICTRLDFIRVNCPEITVQHPKIMVPRVEAASLAPKRLTTKNALDYTCKHHTRSIILDF